MKTTIPRAMTHCDTDCTGYWSVVVSKPVPSGHAYDKRADISILSMRFMQRGLLSTWLSSE